MSKKIQKMLSNDKRQRLQSELRKMDEAYYVLDFDEENRSVMFERWSTGSYDTFSTSYTANEDYSEITVSTDFKEIEVEYQTKYIEKSLEGSKLDKILGYFEKHFGGSSREVAPEEVLPVIKQFNESSDEMVEISPMYCGPDEVDAHGDAMTSVEIEKMVSNANKAISEGTLQSNFDHKDQTDGFTFIKAFVAECDMSIGGHIVSEGTPLLKVKYVDKDLWEARKSGAYTGWSIGAKAGSVVEREI